MDEKRRKKRTLANELERQKRGPGPELTEESRPPESRPFPPEEVAEPGFRERLGRGFRNALVLLLCAFITGLWYYDWNLSDFADRTSDLATSFFDGGQSRAVVAPQSPPLPIPPGAEGGVSPERELNMDMPEYLSTLREAGYGETFSIPTVSALYQAGVPVSYIEELDNGGYLEDTSFPAIIAYHSTGVTVEYLDALKAGGYLERYSFPAITAFYQENITAEYLDGLKERGLLEDLAFHEILIMHQNR